MLLTIWLHSATIGLESEVMRMINTKKIKGRMAELGLTQKDISIALNLSQSTVSQKINNIRTMNLDEAECLAKILSLSSDDIETYFFYTEVA